MIYNNGTVQETAVLFLGVSTRIKYVPASAAERRWRRATDEGRVRAGMSWREKTGTKPQSTGLMLVITSLWMEEPRPLAASRCAGWMDSSFSYYSAKAKVSGARKLPEGWSPFVHILQIYADTSRILYHATASHVASSGSKCRVVCALSVNNGLWHCLKWI